MNREQMLEKIFEQMETLNREQLEALNLFIDNLRKEYLPEAEEGGANEA